MKSLRTMMAAMGSLRKKPYASTPTGTLPPAPAPTPVVAAPAPTPVAPTFTAAPVILGMPTVGVPVVAVDGTATGYPAPSITPTWMLDGVAQGASFTPISGDAGKSLIRRNTAANGTAPDAVSNSGAAIIAAAGLAKNVVSESVTLAASFNGLEYSEYAAGDKPVTGFVARPYFIPAADKTRLLASVTNSEPQAIGSTGNAFGQPLAFISAMNGKVASPGSWNDIADWNLAVSGWAANNAAHRAVAKAACLATARGGRLSTGQYQHIEEYMLETAWVVDLMYSDFTVSERAEVAAFVNTALDDSQGYLTSFWPLANEPHNNYWQNHFLAICVAGLATEGWNARAAEWRTKFETWAAISVTQYTSPFYVGPQVSEGRYYGSYTMNALWAMNWYDKVMGTTFLSQHTVTAENQLELNMFQLSVDNSRFFHVGSEANNTEALFATTPSAAWFYGMFNASQTVTGKTAKAIYSSTVSGVKEDSEAQSNFSRSSKALWNFLWPLNATVAGPLTAKTERRLAPSGGKQLYLRSSAGFDLAGEATSLVVFHSPSGGEPAYSHTNPDAPGLQVSYRGGSAPANKRAFVIVDPEFGGYSGIDAEAGMPGAFSTNAVVPGSLATIPAAGGASPIALFNEDNMGAGVPHYYLSINAQPYWITPSIYRRQYVWLDDLRVQLIHDRIVGGGNKNWQLHTDGNVAISAGLATLTTREGGYTAYIRDLYATDGTLAKKTLGSTGLVATGSTNGLTDSARNWTVNELVGHQINYFDPVSGNSRSGTVASNTAIGITLSGTWIAPAAGVTYRVGDYPRATRILQVGTAADWRSLKVLDLGGRVSASSIDPTTNAGYLQANLTIGGVARTVRFFDDGSHVVVA